MPYSTSSQSSSFIVDKPAARVQTAARRRYDAPGTFLYAANQNSDTIVVFSINRSNGKLKPTGEVVHTPTPVDVEFGPPA